jgi:hypothetical protein
MRESVSGEAPLIIEGVVVGVLRRGGKTSTGLM